MNITTALPTIPPAPMPASEGVSRENLQRTAIKEPASSSQNGTATDAPAGQQVRQSNNRAEKSQRSDENQRSEEAKADGRKAEDKRESERTPEEQREVDQEVRKLKSRDTEVRTHEQAHAAVGGQYAGSPSYEYERGPDGKSYAVGGEVPIDVSAVPGEPQATIQKMQVVRRAALAPAEPSSADRSIAADASSKAAQARAELAKENAPSSSATGNKEAGETQQTATAQGAESTASPLTENGSDDGSQVGMATASGAASTAPGMQRKTLETSVQAGPEQANTLSSAKRGAMIADFYSRRVSPSETGFSATA